MKKIVSEAVNDLSLLNAGLISVPIRNTETFPSFNAFLTATKKQKGFAPNISEPTPKTLKELFENYNRIHSELLLKETGIKKAQQELSTLYGDIREVEKKIRLIKDKKNKALDILDKEAIVPINGELELLDHQQSKLQEQTEPLRQQQWALQESINKLRESLYYPRRFLLRAIAEDLRDKILTKCKDEIQALTAINQEVIGTIVLSKIFDDVENKIDNAEVVINSTIDAYSRSFSKEVKDV